MRTLVIGVLALSAMLVSASVALAAWGWEWNAQLDIDGVETHTAWTVTDGSDPDAYRAQIRVWVPKGTDASVVSQTTSSENVVVLEDKTLVCDVDGVEVRAQYRILPVRGADGTSVAVALKDANGDPFAGATGGLNQKITVNAVLSGAACAGGQAD